MSNPIVKYGLLIGAIGLAVNIVVSAAVGVCGPLMALIMGAIAGLLAVRAMPGLPRSLGARTGAGAGAIAGTLVLLGQLLGGILALAYIQSSHAHTLFGTVPASSDTTGQVGYWIGGIGFGFCLGLVGIGLSAAAGAAAGHLGTPAQTVATYGFVPPEQPSEPTDSTTRPL